MTHSAANKGRSTVNYCQASAFDRPYLSCSDQHDWWVFQEMFFINIFYKFFWTILNLLYWNLNTFTKLTAQVCFLSTCSSFTCFIIILRINALSLPFCTFPLHVNTLDESVLFLQVVLQSLCISMLSIFCTFCITSSAKEKPKSFNLTSNTFCRKI